MVRGMRAGDLRKSAIIADNVTAAPRSYTFDGTTYTPTDRRLRRGYTTLVAMRNFEY